MDYNYHAHTKYCRHASDEIEEYVQKSIENGIKFMGFSEHVPFIFPDGFESHYRILTECVPAYLAECKRLREKYRDKLDLKIGYEMEYYAPYFPGMLKTALEADAEYLILGQHYIRRERPDDTPSIIETEDEKDLIDYVNSLMEGIKTGVYSYVAHPDLINYRGTNEDLYTEQMEKLCRTSLAYNIPLEYNFAGARINRHYPGDRFFQIAGRIGCPITFGMDAHGKDEAYDKETLKTGIEMVKKHNLNYIGMPKLILLQPQKEALYQKFRLDAVTLTTHDEKGESK